MIYFGVRRSFSHLTFSAAEAQRADSAQWQSNPLVNSLLKSWREILIKSNTESLSVAALGWSVLEQNLSSASVFYGDFCLLKWCPDPAPGKTQRSHHRPWRSSGNWRTAGKYQPGIPSPRVPSLFPPKTQRWVLGEPEKSLGLITPRAGMEQGPWKENEREPWANLKEKKSHKTFQRVPLHTCADVY